MCNRAKSRVINQIIKEKIKQFREFTEITKRLTKKVVDLLIYQFNLHHFCWGSLTGRLTLSIETI